MISSPLNFYIFTIFYRQFVPISSFHLVFVLVILSSLRYRFVSSSPRCEWVSDCYLTPNEQFFSCIMARASYIQWNDDVVCFVLDQHAKLDFYSASSLKQQSADRYCKMGNFREWFIFANFAERKNSRKYPLA